MSLRVCVLAVAAATLSFAFVQLTLAAAAAPAATFQAGEAALVARHFEEARQIYAAAAVAPETTPKDRAAALRALAVMTWRLQGDMPLAERLFADALSADGEVSVTQAERARLYATTGRYDDGIMAGDLAVATATSESERKGAALAAARAILMKLKNTNLADQTAGDLAQLARVRVVLQPFSAAPPMPLDLSEALLEVALRLDDGPLALVAWRSYAREGVETGVWAPAGQRLTAALPRWRARGRTPELRNEIFEGLRTSQFFDVALLVADDNRTAGKGAFMKTPRVAEVVLYNDALHRFSSTADAYYRDIANGKGDSGKFLSDLMSTAKTLFESLPYQGPPPPYSVDAMVAELRTRFGALFNAGKTGGVQDFHLGHTFTDEVRAIEQYGRKASIRLVAIDRMVSNGYESWVWDGRQAHGGWASDDSIVQVRPSQADGALRIWDRMTDPAQRAEVEQKIAALSVNDDAMAATAPGVFLPGLATRLEWEGENAILDRLKQRGLSGERLKAGFLIEQSRIKIASNIDAHEGRHVLDKQAFGDKLKSEELEFRAKLSEVAFCEEPRVAFGSIFNPNMADATSPHGRANKRIAAGIVAWMGAHRAAIAGLDAKRPLLPQFDKLTSDQMRATMRAMDPWAPKA